MQYEIALGQRMQRNRDDKAILVRVETAKKLIRVALREYEGADADINAEQKRLMQHTGDNTANVSMIVQHNAIRIACWDKQRYSKEINTKIDRLLDKLHAEQRAQAPAVSMDADDAQSQEVCSLQGLIEEGANMPEL